MHLCAVSRIIGAETKEKEMQKGDRRMKFRPCIDIHNGKVKQIVGGSLKDAGDTASENFVSEKDAAWYARFYQKDGIRGGHVILLNGADSPYYEETKKQAKQALTAYPGGLQIGGGIRDTNAKEYLDAGASHVIVTSFVFKDGRFHPENLEKMVKAVGREHLVLDVSCRKKDGNYYIVTDRWQKFTEVVLTPAYWMNCPAAARNFWSMRWMWREKLPGSKKNWRLC